METTSTGVDDETVSAPTAPAPESMHRRFRLAAIVASVVAAIAGSALLVVHRSSEQESVPTGTALPPGGKVIAAIRVGRGGLPVRGGGPFAVGEGAVWATSSTKSRLMRIDPAQNRIVARIKVHTPETVAAGDGGVWLSNPSEDTVTRVDPTTNTVTATIPVGRQPEGIAVSPGAVWVANAGDSSVSRIDPATNRVVATISVGSEARLLRRAHERHRVVACRVGRPPVREQHRARRSGDEHRGRHHEARVFALRRSRRRRGRRLVGRLRRRRANRLSHEQDHGAVSPSRIRVGLERAFGSVWVATGGGNVDQIDPQSGRLVARLHVGGLPVRLGVGFGSMWVNDDFGRVLRIEPQR